jgi:hypothetical protein
MELPQMTIVPLFAHHFSQGSRLPILNETTKEFV